MYTYISADSLAIFSRGPLLVDEHIEEPDRTPHGVEAALNIEECGSLQSEASMGVSEEAIEDAYGSNQSSVVKEKINQYLAEGKGSNETIETIIMRVESRDNRDNYNAC